MRARYAACDYTLAALGIDPDAEALDLMDLELATEDEPEDEPGDVTGETPASEYLRRISNALPGAVGSALECATAPAGEIHRDWPYRGHFGADSYNACVLMREFIRVTEAVVAAEEKAAEGDLAAEFGESAARTPPAAQ